MKTLAYKIRTLLILIVFSLSAVVHAAVTETEYLGNIVVSGAADDKKWGSFPIGFDFDFFGNTYDEFWVSSNGLVMFESGSNAFSNVSIPDDRRPDNYIAPFWDDLVVHSSGDIMYQTIGTAPDRKLVIQWSNMSFWTSTVQLGTIQVILYEGSNNIQMQYKSIVDLSSDRATGGEATIGLENVDGTAGVLCSYDTPGFVHSGKAVLFTPGGGTYTYDENALYDPVLLVNEIPRPGIPILISPIYNSIAGDTVTFQWEESSNTSSYFVIISQNADLTNPVHTSADLTGLSYEYILAVGQTYYWSVNSRNSAGDVSWSETWTFQTSTTPPLLAVPQTVSLEQGELQQLTLHFTGGDTGPKTATLSSLPAEGILYQNNAGVPGAEITAVPSDVSDAAHQVFYRASGGTGNGLGNFNFHFTDGTGTSADNTYTINVLPPSVPTFVHAAKGTDRVEITFDRNMGDPTGKHLEFAVEDNGVAVTSTSCQLKAGDPATIVLFVSPNLNTANAITVAYTRGTVLSETGIPLETFDFQLAAKLVQDLTFDPLMDRVYGDADFTLSATASSGLPVTFSSSNPAVVSVSGSTASIHNVGESYITATQVGDDTYSAVSFDRIQVVNKGTGSIVFSNMTQDYTGSGVSATVATVPAGLNVNLTYNGSTELPVDLGSHTVDAVIEDQNYSGSASDVLVISDLSGPVPDVASLPVLIDECSVTPVAPTATDLYSGQVTGTTGTPFPITTQGSTVITWIYEDGFGNTSTQSQTIAINDVSDPVTPTLADQITECSVPAVAPTTTDACAGTITGTTTDPLSYPGQGVYVINWTFADGNGNSVNAAQNVIVADLSPPVPPTLTDLTGECTVTATAPATLDACEGIITGTTTDPLSYSSEGTYVINWTFDDGNGNSIIVGQNVILDDVTPPVVPTLPDVTGECTATVTATVPTTMDACTGVITGTTTDPLSYSTAGTFVINWTFDDGNGNSIIVPQNVIVSDTTPPDMPTLADLFGECTVTAVAPTTTDACAGVITGTTSDPLSYTIAGTYVITWTFDDGGGNSINATQNVTISDVTPPEVPNLATLNGECSVTAVAPTTTDACVGLITATTTDPLTYSTQGSYVIDWTFSDGNGNFIVVPQNVLVRDVTPPTATAPADLISCDGTVGFIGLTAIMDNCSTPVESYVLSGATTGSGSGDASAVVFNPGVTAVTYTLDDGNGNSMQYSFTVTHQAVENIVVTVDGGTLTCNNTGSYQWINCADNSLVAGETASTFRPDADGTYAVILTQGSCSDTSDCNTIANTGIDTDISQDYKVYPNPARDYVTLDMVNEQTNVTLRVVEMTGQIIRVEEIDRFTKIDLDVSDLKNGLYIIQIHSDQMNSVARVIKE